MGQQQLRIQPGGLQAVLLEIMGGESGTKFSLLDLLVVGAV